MKGNGILSKADSGGQQRLPCLSDGQLVGVEIGMTVLSERGLVMTEKGGMTRARYHQGLRAFTTPIASACLVLKLNDAQITFPDRLRYKPCPDAGSLLVSSCGPSQLRPPGVCPEAALEVLGQPLRARPARLKLSNNDSGRAVIVRSPGAIGRRGARRDVTVPARSSEVGQGQARHLQVQCGRCQGLPPDLALEGA